MHQQQFIHGIAQQVAVVAHQDEGALVGLQSDFQGVAHIQVEVVGGLIQYQQVGALPHDHGQGEAGLFAAGEGRDRAGGGIAAKIEAAQEVEDVLLPGLGAEALQVQGGAGLQIQGFELLLVKIADLAVFPAGPLARQQGQVAYQALQQGGLTGAIFTQQAVAAARAQVQLHPASVSAAAP